MDFRAYLARKSRALIVKSQKVRGEDWELRQTKMQSVLRLSVSISPSLSFDISLYQFTSLQSHLEFRKFHSAALADVTVVPLHARNFRYFYLITRPLASEAARRGGISIEFQTKFKLRLIWLAAGKREREGRSRQPTRVFSRRRCVRVRFRAVSRSGMRYTDSIIDQQPRGSLKRHDIYKQSVVRFVLDRPARGKAETQHNSYISLFIYK